MPEVKRPCPCCGADTFIVHHIHDDANIPDTWIMVCQNYFNCSWQIFADSMEELLQEYKEDLA